MNIISGKRLSLGLRSILVVLAVGAAVGSFGGPVFVLIPWALIGLAIGFLCISAKVAAINGALYGFALAYAFMIAGYQGAAPLATRLLPFAVLGLVGAVCGALLTLVGFGGRKLARKR